MMLSQECRIAALILRHFYSKKIQSSSSVRLSRLAGMNVVALLLARKKTCRVALWNKCVRANLWDGDLAYRRDLEEEVWDPGLAFSD
jgi:hypothetical protein